MTRRGTRWIGLLAALGLAAFLVWMLLPRAEPPVVPSASDDGASPERGAAADAAEHAAELARGHPTPPGAPVEKLSGSAERTLRMEERRRQLEAEQAKPATFAVRDVTSGDPVPNLEVREGQRSPRDTRKEPPWTGRSDADGAVRLPERVFAPRLVLPEPWRVAGVEKDVVWVYRTWNVSGRILPPPGDDEADVSRVQFRVALEGTSPRYDSSDPDGPRLRALYGLFRGGGSGRQGEGGGYTATVPWVRGAILVAQGKGWRATAVTIPYGDLARPPESLDLTMRRAIRVRGHVTTPDGTPIDGYEVRCRIATKGEPLVEAGILGGDVWAADGGDQAARSSWQSSGPNGAFWFELPFDGDVTLVVKHAGTVVATENLGWSAGDRVDVAIRVIGK